MSQKRVSMIKKQRLIKEELRNFPIFGISSQSLKLSHISNKSGGSLDKSSNKKKGGLQRGKSMEAERSKVLQSTIYNFKKCRETMTKSSGLLKRKKQKNMKEKSISRTSLVSVSDLISFPSTTALNTQSQISRLTQQNVMVQQIRKNTWEQLRNRKCIQKVQKGSLLIFDNFRDAKNQFFIYPKSKLCSSAIIQSQSFSFQSIHHQSYPQTKSSSHLKNIDHQNNREYTMSCIPKRAIRDREMEYFWHVCTN